MVPLSFCGGSHSTVSVEKKSKGANIGELFRNIVPLTTLVTRKPCCGPSKSV